MLIKLFNATIQTPLTMKLQLQMNKDNSSDLFFQQILEYEKESKDKEKKNDPDREKEMIPYKSLQMLACRFNEGEEEMIKHHIKYRHKIAKV